MSKRLDALARVYDGIADELELAATHARTSARHFRNEELPRGFAHAWAVHGHVSEARVRLDQQAREHARLSNPDPAE
jgi:predicted ATPase